MSVDKGTLTVQVTFDDTQTSVDEMTAQLAAGGYEFEEVFLVSQEPEPAVLRVVSCILKTRRLSVRGGLRGFGVAAAKAVK